MYFFKYTSSYYNMQICLSFIKWISYLFPWNQKLDRDLYYFRLWWYLRVLLYFNALIFWYVNKKWYHWVLEETWLIWRFFVHRWRYEMRRIPVNWFIREMILFLGQQLFLIFYRWLSIRYHRHLYLVSRWFSIFLICGVRFILSCSFKNI
jgi:hypothetical protein